MKKTTKEKRAQNLKFNLKNLKLGKKRASNHKKILKKNKISKKIVIYKLSAPEHFILNNVPDRELLITLIAKANQYLTDPRVKIKIDFSKTKKMNPCGTLYFMAQIDRLLMKYRGRVTCNYPNDEIVGQLLQHFGLLEKMGLPPKFTITAESVLPWHYVVGTKADTSKFSDLMQSYENELEKPMRLGLYDSMAEAVTNCAHHAYDEAQRILPEEQKWWMFAQKSGLLLTVAIYDSGIGIPESLRKKPELKDFIKGLNFRNRRSDKRLLLAAVGSNKSSTKLPYRGLGLPEMLNFVQKNSEGGLLIHSNRGAFMYRADTANQSTGHYDKEIAGTLIQWTLPLIDGEQNG